MTETTEYPLAIYHSHFPAEVRYYIVERDGYKVAEGHYPSFDQAMAELLGKWPNAVMVNDKSENIVHFSLPDSTSVQISPCVT